MNSDIILKAIKNITPRFSEVDSMNIVWHGSYPLYFEDAREAFGEKYGLGYLFIFNHGYYAPLVELSFQYKKPIAYDMACRVEIMYCPTDAAKIIFDYKIYDIKENQLRATGHSVQVFMDMNYQLCWTNPEFYEKWKEQWLAKQ